MYNRRNPLKWNYRLSYKFHENFSFTQRMKTYSSLTKRPSHDETWCHNVKVELFLTTMAVLRRSGAPWGHRGIPWNPSSSWWESGYCLRSRVSTLLMTQSPCCKDIKIVVLHVFHVLNNKISMCQCSLVIPLLWWLVWIYKICEVDIHFVQKWIPNYGML